MSERCSLTKTETKVRFQSTISGVKMHCPALGEVCIEDLPGGNTYRLSITASLGEYDLERLFFDLQPDENRDTPFRMGPVNTTFGPGTLGEYLPPRMDCSVDGEFHYSLWFDCPSLAQLLNCPEIVQKYPFLKGYHCNHDDGFGAREFTFTAEGAIEMKPGASSLRLVFPSDFGTPVLQTVSLQREERVLRAQTYDLAPVTVAHPRLFAAGNADLFRREMQRKSPELLLRFKALLDKKLGESPEEVPLQNPDGKEYWDAFDRIACYSFGYMVFRNETYFCEARRHSEWLFSRPHWGKHMENDECGKPWSHYWCDVDMCQGITPFLAGIFFYDWCHDRIDKPLLEKVENKLLHHAEILYRHYLMQLAEWACQFNNDHFTGNVYPIQLCGFLFADKYPDAKKYLDIGRVCFDDSCERCFAALRRPETYHTQLPLLGYAWLYRDFYGENLMAGIDASRQIHTRLISCLEGDLSRTYTGWSESEACLYYGIADLTGSPYAQWIAEELSRNPVQGNVKLNGFRKVMELIFRNPEIDCATPQLLPRTLLDAEKAAFYYRESWSDLVTKEPVNVAGLRLDFQKPILDRDIGAPDIRARSYWGSPFAGHFTLFAGEEFLISPLIPTYEFMTAKGNCMTVDGKGQAGEGPSFVFPRLAPQKKLELFYPEPESIPTINGELQRTSLSADLTGLYDSSLVERYVRSFVIEEQLDGDNSGILLTFTVTDDVRASQPRHFEFSLVSGLEIVALDTAGTFSIAGESGVNLQVRISGSNPHFRYELSEMPIVRSYMPSHDRLPQRLRVANAGLDTELRVIWQFVLKNRKES